MRNINYIISQIDDGKTIERFLKSRFFSSSLITELKKSEIGILLNGKPVFAVSPVKCGDILTINIADELPSQNITPQNLGFSVLYEDDDYLVYDKPSGVVVHPTKVYQSETLGNDYVFRCSIQGDNGVFRPVYRIDRNTSGLVVIAKNKLSAATKIDKEYCCICSGKLQVNGIFDQPIGLCDNSKIKRTVRSDGQLAKTRYWLIAQDDDYSFARVVLFTGRTHQIRTHFSCNGHPLVGDDLYGGETDVMQRQALHCSFVRFKHIVTDKEITLTSDLPDDMSNFLKNRNISY